MRLELKDGEVVGAAGSVEELVSFYRGLTKNAPSAPAKTQAFTKAAKNGNSFAGLTDAPMSLLRLLYKHPGDLDSGEIAKNLGVTAKSIGGTVASLVGWGKRHNLERQEMLIKGRRSNGSGRKIRTMGLTSNFRKMIEEGVLGVKLDS